MIVFPSSTSTSTAPAHGSNVTPGTRTTVITPNTSNHGHLLLVPQQLQSKQKHVLFSLDQNGSVGKIIYQITNHEVTKISDVTNEEEYYMYE
jgi:hypothetical protein